MSSAKKRKMNIRIGSLASVLSNKAEMGQDGNITIESVIYPEYYQCCICREYLTEDAGYCNNLHCTCVSCYEKWNKKSCPLCKDSTYEKSSIITDIAKNLKINCNNYSYGCFERIFKMDMDHHLENCNYSECECPICHKGTRIANLYTHLKTECGVTFDIEHITSPRYYLNYVDSNTILESKSGRLLIIVKEDTCLNLTCIDFNVSTESVIKLIIKEKDDSYIDTETRISLPINNISSITEKDMKNYKLSMSRIKGSSSIRLIGFLDKFEDREREWRVKDRDDNWLLARVVDRDYIRNKVKFKFHLWPEDKYDEWVDLDTEPFKIRLIIYNE